MRRVVVLALSALLLGLFASNEADAGGGYDAGKPYAAAKRAGSKYRAATIRPVKRIRHAYIAREPWDTWGGSRPPWRARPSPLGVPAYYDIALGTDWGYGSECALVRHLRVWDGYTYRPTWAYPCSYY